ncbi:MAG: cytochrome d ubiquinol oxidase subunit II [Muribaculaceae bacterium]|nr:cytochrome d ubiquinol oxidase subunit II [Muribaculaceae bacterium]
MEALQIYWWFVISLLGGLLVALLFVQGGQTFLWSCHTQARKSLFVNALGRKWELTFTTLVTFGGAFFASFPLYYSTSFGGAYWLWMLILFSFILQAVSYEFRSKPGNIFGTKTYDSFLFVNGCVGCVLLGCAVGMQFFGADFSVSRHSILDSGSPVISVWNDAHGLEVIVSPRNLLLGFTVLFLARTAGVMFFYQNVQDPDQTDFQRRARGRILINGAVFVVLFLLFMAALCIAPGYTVEPDGSVAEVPHKYLLNFIEMWWIGAFFLAGVLAVLYSVVRSVMSPAFRSQCFWWISAGTVAVVTALFCVSGYNNTAYLPSVSQPSSSLTIANSSSTEFTLTVMAWVTCLLPLVIGYIAYVWHKLTSPRITRQELAESDHNY